MLDTATLQRGLAQLSPARDSAAIALLVQRLPEEQRATPWFVTLDPERGLIGDKWASGKRNPEAMVTLMRFDVASLMGDPVQFGDNLFASIDTSAENLPPGTLVMVGSARCEVTPKAHTGCHKFARRAGDDALAITRDPAWIRHQLRGVHLRVLEGGLVSVGDALVVLSRQGGANVRP
jgi:hypothetical protein